MKTLLKFLLYLLVLALLVGAAALAGYLFLDKGEQRNVFTFVPEDFVYVIESDQPINDWQNLSKSRVWQYLKQHEYFAEISESADYLDSLLNHNQTLVRLIKLGDLVISAHMTSRDDYEFIFLVDLKNAGKLGKLQAFLTPLFENLNYQVSRESYFNIDILRLYDPESDETLSLAILDNILVGSYDDQLIRKAIAQTESGSITDNLDFAQVRQRTNRDDLYTIYLNYHYLDDLILAYTSPMPELLEGIDEVLSFSSFDLSLSDEEAAFRGYMKQVDTVPSFLSVFRDVGQGRVLAPGIMPARTAMFTSVGFDDFEDFYQRWLSYYREQKPDEYKKLEKNIGRTEKLLKINFEEDFFSWMTDEVAMAIIPTNEAGDQYDYYAMLHFDDYELAKEKLDFVREQIRKRTPLKFRAVDYRGFPIQYLDLNGFFKLFFKKMFSRIEKPHYTFIDDYVVFSNDTTALQYVIDEYLQNNTLKSQEYFEDFREEFRNKSNIFAYIQNAYFFEYMLQNVDSDVRQNLIKNKQYLLSFPQIGLQVSPGGNMYEAFLLAQFAPFEEEVLN
ncbi:MAG: DUF3352 domain-containing protein [Bacteroidetes bacterium]|nr:MAG: DUF3352 domain-containing protein [Bacteroidota bacterium]